MATKYKPYPAYKDSGILWLGEVPVHWEALPVWILFEIGRGRVISNEEIMDNLGEYPVYSSQTENDGIMGRLATYDFEGDYLTWTTDGANAGTVFRRYGKFNCTNVCGTLKARSKKAVLDYCVHALSISTASFVRQDINPKLMNNVMAKIRIPIPSISEQQTIATFLDRETVKIDTLIAKQEHLIELLQEKRTALISHAVTKGLNPDAPTKDSGVEWLGKVPVNWEVSGLTKYLESVIDYRGRTPTKVVEGVFLLTARNIRNGTIDYDASQEFIAESEYEEVMRRGKPAIGDLLFTTEAPLGQVANVDRADIALAQRIIKFRGQAGVLNNYFLKYWIMGRFCQSNLEQLATGSTALGIKGSKVGQVRLCLPPYEEQGEIIQYLDQQTVQIDTLIQKSRHAIDFLKERRTALISAAVTGKIDVRDGV